MAGSVKLYCPYCTCEQHYFARWEKSGQRTRLRAKCQVCRKWIGRIKPRKRPKKHPLTRAWFKKQIQGQFKPLELKGPFLEKLTGALASTESLKTLRKLIEQELDK